MTTKMIRVDASHEALLASFHRWKLGTYGNSGRP